jgi:VanZ family protein
MEMPGRKRKIFASLLAVFTIGLMAGFFNLYEPWEAIGPERIPDGSFNSPAATNFWSGWNEWTRLEPDGGVNRSPGVVLTCSPEEHGILRLTISDLTDIPAFRVSLRATTQHIVQGKKKHYVPRAIFFYHDANAQSLFHLHHGIIDLPHDTGWKRYTDFFPVPEDAVNARLHIQNLGVSGTMRIDDLSIIPVRESPSTPWWKLFFGTLWMTAFGVGLFVLRPWAHRLGPLIMLVLALIMAGIVMPGEQLDRTIESSLHTTKRLIAHPAAPPPAVRAAKPVSKQPVAPAPDRPKTEPIFSLPGTGVDQVHQIGHFSLFSLLAFLCALSWIGTPLSKRRVLAVLACLITFAAATEVLQFIPAGRSAGLNDLCVDTAGMTGAVVLVCLMRLIKRIWR